MINDLRISLVQSNLYWEDKEKNLSHFEEKLRPLKGKSDLAVLPETFTTGFTMNVVESAETNGGKAVSWLKTQARELNLAICGSFIAEEEGRFYNRGFFVTPQGDTYFYDKRHLFRMGGEHDYYAQGDTRTIISYEGWNIRPAICYDLRFPVWLRNTQDNSYDLLLFPANWARVRMPVWDTLLKARAIENQCYVCGVNRVGEDINGVQHSGHSVLIDFKGSIVTEIEEDTEATVTCTISKESLDRFRAKFPAWMDADRFEIK